MAGSAPAASQPVNASRSSSSRAAAVRYYASRQTAKPEVPDPRPPGTRRITAPVPRSSDPHPTLRFDHQSKPRNPDPPGRTPPSRPDPAGGFRNTPVGGPAKLDPPPKEPGGLTPEQAAGLRLDHKTKPLHPEPPGRTPPPRPDPAGGFRNTPVGGPAKLDPPPKEPGGLTPEQAAGLRLDHKTKPPHPEPPGRTPPPRPDPRWRVPEHPCRGSRQARPSAQRAGRSDARAGRGPPDRAQVEASAPRAARADAAPASGSRRRLPERTSPRSAPDPAPRAEDRPQYDHSLRLRTVDRSQYFPRLVAEALGPE